ncbi:hypothetical protein [Pseudomonas lutea]|uniref:hypothetical protein n=1 Tax=Pseudomonas lutea TaxID=243924 RepID=UPI000877DCE2|nr:hypothetical protein [Pseudomonas lutea]
MREAFNRLDLSFFEIFCLFLRDATSSQSRLFGLTSFSPDELIKHDFERVGECDDYHFFEKLYCVSHRNRDVAVVFKLYFYRCQQIGSGFDVLKGVRLTSLLTNHMRFDQRQPDMQQRPLELYFSKDQKEGAVILQDSIVIRFSHSKKRDGYQVDTLESDSDKSGTLNRIATNTIRHTMDFYDLDLSDPGLNARNASAGLRRLIDTLTTYRLSSMATF